MDIISADVSYLIYGDYGICLNYLVFKTSNSIDNVVLYNKITNELLGIGKMEDNITISAIELGVFQRKFLTENVVLNYFGFLGYSSYLNEAKLINTPFKTEGSTVSLSGKIGLDFLIGKNFALGISLSYLIGSFSDCKVNQQSVNIGKESLNRFDFNGGIELYF